MAVVDLQVPQCRPFDLPGGKHGVLLIHGFTGSPSHMRMPGELLNAQGFTVKGICLPGHAASIKEMAAADWRQWLSAAQAGLDELRAACDYVSVAGLSMGGCLALILAERNPWVTACGAISAPMGTKTKGLSAARVLSLVMKEIHWSDGNGEKSVLDPFYARGYSGFPTAKGWDLHVLIKKARTGLQQLTCPLVVVQSHQDETITENSADIIMKHTAAVKKQMLWLEGVPHACTASRPHAEQIAEALGRVFRSAELARS